jgi:signal transduction histidine kinase
MENTCVIQDYGCWIEKVNMEKIFWRFFQEKQNRNWDGFWIWLALVSKISLIYKWKIKVKSEKNQGTTFIINF